MGSITVATVFAKVREQLFDATPAYRFSDEALLGWLNSGQRQIVLLKPNANVTNESVQLAAGIKQDLPDAGVALIDIVRNMGSTGTAAGSPISRKERKAFDTMFPGWSVSASSPTVKYFMFDEADQKRFYIYPPQPAIGMGYVEIIMSALPADASNPGTITLDDIYEMPLVDYMVYRGFRREDPQKAAMFYQSFMEAVTGKWQGERVLQQQGAAK